MVEFTNKATLSYNGASIDSNTVSGTREVTTELTKTALVPTYEEGPVTFIVSFVNNGAGAVSGLTLTDDLGAYTVGEETVYPFAYVRDSVKVYLSGVEQTPVEVTSTQPLVLTAPDVPAGGNLLVVYAVTPTVYAPRGDGQGVTNTVTATAPSMDTPAEASADVLSAQAAELALTKSVFPLELTEGEEVTYTIVVLNSGNKPAGDAGGPVIADTLDPALSQLSVTLDGVALEEGTGYTYDPDTGAFATVAGAVTVPAAVCTQDPATGIWSSSPGASTLRISGTV